MNQQEIIDKKAEIECQLICQKIEKINKIKDKIKPQIEKVEKDLKKLKKLFISIRSTIHILECEQIEVATEISSKIRDSIEKKRKRISVLKKRLVIIKQQLVKTERKQIVLEDKLECDRRNRSKVKIVKEQIDNSQSKNILLTKYSKNSSQKYQLKSLVENNIKIIIFDRIQELIAKQLGIKSCDVKLNSNCRSLMKNNDTEILELVMNMEDKFKMKLDYKNIKQMDNLAILVDFIKDSSPIYK